MQFSLPFTSLTQWQQLAFSAALLERMLPNYQMFAEVASFGDSKIVRNQLDLIWQWLDQNNRCKINYDAQLTKLEPNIPNPEEFEFFGVLPALDVCMSIMSIFQSMQEKDDISCQNVSKLSLNSVTRYIEWQLTQEDETEEIIEEQIAQDPLLQWELATQQELFDFIKLAPENKKTCQYAKSLVMEEGLSNLGIEVN